MEKQLKVVYSKKEPVNKNVVWLHPDEIHDVAVLIYNNGSWEPLKTIDVPDYVIDKINEYKENILEYKESTDAKIETIINVSLDTTNVANTALNVSEQANNKADTAIQTANDAKLLAEGAKDISNEAFTMASESKVEALNAMSSAQQAALSAQRASISASNAEQSAKSSATSAESAINITNSFNERLNTQEEVLIGIIDWSSEVDEAINTFEKALADEATARSNADNAIGVRIDEINNRLNEELLESIYAYGVEFDTTISSPSCKRLGNISLHKSLPIQSKMRGCLLDDSGAVKEYLPNNDWTNSVRDGSKGQVMVEIPVHYRKCVTDGTKRQVWLSEVPIAGYHEVNVGYISAYQATVQRSTNKLASVVNLDVDYRGGNNNANYDNTSNSFLGKPASSISRTNFRTYARNRNTSNANWNCMTYDMQKALYWLFVVEYATLNSQASYNAALTSEGLKQGGLGPGVTILNGDKWNNFNGYNPFIPCGITDTLGNNTGIVKYEMPEEYDSSILTINVSRYRGIENPFGHIWQWIDGINIRISPNIEDGGDGLSKVFVCSNPEYFSDVSYDGYNYVGNESRLKGYVKEVIFGDNGEIIPSVCTGSSTTYHCDNHYTNIPTTETLRGVLFGGVASYGASAGFSFSSSDVSPTATNAYFGSRLIYIPN